jgi:ketosteroid isomerase-like protein
MCINALAARLLVDAAHLAWSNRDTGALMACYCDDIRYTCNTGPSSAEPFVAVGKSAMLGFLEPVLEITESMSVVEHFVLNDNVARATVSCFVKHNATGHVLSGSYRQILVFRDGKIAEIEEFHDAARIAAFWKMVHGDVRPNDRDALAKDPPDDAGHD